MTELITTKTVVFSVKNSIEARGILQGFLIGDKNKAKRYLNFIEYLKKESIFNLLP